MAYMNLAPLFASAVVYMIVSWLWYGQFFASPWSRMTGKSHDDIPPVGLAKRFVIGFFLAFFMSYMLATFSIFTMSTSLWDGIQLGAYVWAAFIIPVLAGMVSWEKRPFKLFLIDAGFYLTVLMSMGYIVTVWR